MNMPHLLALLLAFVFALPDAEAQQQGSRRNFVKYVDDKGTINFTDSLNKVPPEYRSRAEPIDPRQYLEPVSKTTTFKFRPSLKQVVISAKLNDKVSVKMWIDPAADQSVLSLKAAKELGIDPTDPSLQKIDLIVPGEKFNVPVAKINTVDLQGRVARNVYFALSDYADTENFLGVLGKDFLSQFIVNFDQAGGKLVLEDKR